MSYPCTYDRDPKAVRISVYYTESSSVYEGMPVCYEFDATTNWLGVSDFETESSTTAEGSHNEGKFIRVEDPDADNIQAFAGVVAKGSPLIGSTGPGRIDIYIPNGAIVPVRNDQNCTVGRTVLAVHNAEQHLTAPLESGARPVAIAMETVDTATTTGLCLAKLDTNLFLYQKGDAVNLEVDDEDTGMMVVNRIQTNFKQATGNCVGLWVQAESSAGAASNGYGLAGYFQADVTATPSTHIAGTGVWMNVTGGTPTEYLFPLEIGLYEDGATLSGISRLAVLSLTHQVADAPTTNRFSWLHLAQNGAEASDALIIATNLATLPAIAMTGTITLTTGDYLIKVYLPNQSGTQQWYIPLIANRTTG